MKTTNKGKLAITVDDNGSPQVIFEPVNGTVWLHKSELSSLFCVTRQTVNASLNSLSRGGIVDIKKTCFSELCVSANHVRHDLREVNMEVIIAMAFQISSPQAKILRKWFVRRCLYGIGIVPLEMQNYHWN